MGFDASSVRFLAIDTGDKDSDKEEAEGYAESDRVKSVSCQSKEELLVTVRTILQDLAQAHWELVKNRKKWRKDGVELAKLRTLNLTKEFSVSAPKAALASRHKLLLDNEAALSLDGQRNDSERASLAEEKRILNSDREKLKTTMASLTDKAEMLLEREAMLDRREAEMRIGGETGAPASTQRVGTRPLASNLASDKSTAVIAVVQAVGRKVAQLWISGWESQPQLMAGLVLAAFSYVSLYFA